MRPLLLTVALLIASSASAQQGGVWYGGPWQPSRVAPTFNYYNPSGVTYPVGANAFGAGGYGYWQQRAELRRLRWAVEDANAYRGW